MEVAARGIETMKKYTSLDRRASHWRVQLEEDPLGQGAIEQRRAEAQAAAAAAARAAKAAALPPRQ